MDTQIVRSLFLAAILAPTWIILAVLSRMQIDTFLPQGIRFALSSVTIALLGLVFFKRLPQISLRLFHSAVTVSTLAYVLSPIFCFFALRTLSSSMAALCYVTIPIWFLLIAFQEGMDRLYEHFFVVLALGVFLLGIYTENSLRGDVVPAVFLLLAGVVSFMAGSWVSRRLFWLHSAHDLNFWSMLFATAVHLLLAISVGEYENIGNWDRVYWIYLGVLGLLVTGLGAFLYRVRSDPISALLLTILVPLGALVLGYALWGETPMNIYTMLGATVVILILARQSMMSKPNKWLCMYLSNDKRQGGRLLCMLPGFISAGEGKEEVSLQVTDIAYGGLGFQSESEIPKSKNCRISLNMGQQNRIVLDCEVLYGEAIEDPGRFHWRGGLAFRNMSDSRWQSLIEFLARMARAEEE